MIDLSSDASDKAVADLMAKLDAWLDHQLAWPAWDDAFKHAKPSTLRDALVRYATLAAFRKHHGGCG